MKKIFALTLAACSLASMAFLLSSCEEPDGASVSSDPLESSSIDDSTSTHEHAFATAWTSDDTHHWHVCEGDCEEISDKAEHTYDETEDESGKITKICTVCEHTVVIAPPHQHVFEGAYLSDKNGHWQTCSTDDCNEKTDSVAHNFMQETTHGADYIETVYTCDVCAYTYTDRITIETVVPDEKSWIDAFNELDYTNYTINVYFEAFGSPINNKVCISETAAYYLMDYSAVSDMDNAYLEYYSVQNEDGTYNNYVRDSKNEQFMLLNDHSNMGYVNARMESLLALKYDQHYDSFVYNEEKGSYICTDIIETDYHPDPENTEYNLPIYCKNVEIKIADGKIIYVSSDYVVWYGQTGTPTESDFQSQLLYDNIGLTVVTVPSDVLENALPDDGSYGPEQE